MNERIRKLLEEVSTGKISIDNAMLQLKLEPYQDLNFAKLDYHREIRQGVTEIIYGAGKTAQQIIEISKDMLSHGQENILITRISQNVAKVVQNELPLKYHEVGDVGTIGSIPIPTGKGKILVATGGTSDIPIAEECSITAEFLGNEVVRLYDVGVSGLHRLLLHIEEIMSARVIVAIAGMEGALASVIGGLADCPVIAVPTSVGYGTSFNGLSALLSMLNSCASGVSVVNIDNGFGAGYQASMINHL
ncbi:MAG: nickel pincer cofactor biosynthesis protein LarB [Oscillospiraceae bacterium]